MAPKRSQSRQKALRQGGATTRPRPETATAGAGGGRSSSQSRPAARSYRKPQRSFWRGPYPYVGVLAIVLVVVLVVVVVSRINSNGTPQSGNIAAAVHKVTTVPQSVFDQVGTGNLNASQLPISAVQSPTTLTGSDGKPEVLYMGGEYCPYCAADRWVMLAALARFGTFSGVQSMFSSSTDVYPNTPTFTFAHTTYTSQYVDFVPVELYDRDQKALQQPTAQQQQLMQMYDQGGGIPFLLIGGQFVGTTPFTPQSLAGKNQQQVAATLSDPTQGTTKDIVGNANLLTATICTITQGQPSTVCQSPGVQKAGQMLGVKPSA